MVVKRLTPTVIVVCGSAPEVIFGNYSKAGIEIVQFDRETSRARGEVA